MKTLKTFLVVSVLLLVTACGGGSSSSGGGVEVSQTITFTGTYTTDIYSGDLIITVFSPNNNSVSISGVPCITQTLTEGVVSRFVGDNFNVFGPIPNSPGPSLADPIFNIVVPQNGGEGMIDIDPGEGCVSVGGTVSLTRS